MGKRAAYRIEEEEKLILEYYSGDILLWDMFHLKDIISQDVKYDKTFDIIHDLRNADIIVDLDDIKHIKSHLESRPETIARRRGANITSEPNQVVFTTLFSKMLHFFPMESKVFTTLSAALCWLGQVNNHEARIENIFKDLSMQANVIMENCPTVIYKANKRKYK